MNHPTPFADIRSLIARDDLPAALKMMRELLEHSPQLDEVLHQSGRFENIRKQIRLGIAGNEQANVEQNRIRAALLEMLTEIEQKGQAPELRSEIARAMAIVNSKNVVTGSVLSAGGNITIGDTHHHYGDKKIPRNLTNPPFDPPVFLGREEELQTVHDRLFGGDNFLMLVNGQGGMGKTSFAAKYWKNYATEYTHRAFFFVGNGIENELLRIAPELNLVFPDTMPGRERLQILLKQIAELDHPCLIILDNANDADDLDAHYPLLRSCSNCHLLITSRLAALRESPIHAIGALSEALALQLFQGHYPKHRESDNALFFGIFQAVGGNTLVVEILAKNLREMNSNEVFYPLETLLNDLQERGLLRLSEQATIRVDWQSLEKSTPEQIISAMYDLRPLAPGAIALLSAFAVLPAENIAYEMLKTLLTPADARAFSQQLNDLYQKGWIEKNDIDGLPYYKCNPVVQEMVRQKNPQLPADCAGLMKQLIEKLKYEGGAGHLINASYEEAAVFTRYAETMFFGIQTPNSSLSILCERIGNYHRTTGNLERAYFFQDKCLAINQTLLATEPDNMNFKNSLAISYCKLGDTQMALGNLDKALNFFKQFNQLEKELHKTFPRNIEFKDGLAVSYQFLGNAQIGLCNLNMAFDFYKQYNKLEKELYEFSRQDAGFKNGLAISYSKLGLTQMALGNFESALDFVEQFNQLEKELCETFPQNVEFKNNLAISYEQLGSTNSGLGNLESALNYFKQYNQIARELYEDSPKNIEFKKNWAISYLFLGQFHRDHLNDRKKAKQYLQKGFELYDELVRDFPDYQALKHNYTQAQKALSDLENL